jgi:hypothetical protein
MTCLIRLIWTAVLDIRSTNDFFRLFYAVVSPLKGSVFYLLAECQLAQGRMPSCSLS